jgi:Sec-independent protein translocase protein TatA
MHPLAANGPALHAGEFSWKVRLESSAHKRAMLVRPKALKAPSRVLVCHGGIMADRKKTLSAFAAYKALTVGNKNLNEALAEDIVDSINWAFDAIDKIETGRKAKFVDFNTLKPLASDALGYANSAAKSVGKAIDGGVTQGTSPAAKSLARAIGELRNAVTDLVKALDKDFATNKTVQADAELPKEAKSYSKIFEGLVKDHAEHLRDVRELSLDLKKCIDDDTYSISTGRFLQSDLKGLKPKGEWSPDFCDDLIKVLNIQVGSDRRDQHYGGYGGKLIKVLPGFNGLFTFASPAVAKAHDKYKQEADDAYETITQGAELLIPDMCKRMIKDLEGKKKNLRKPEKGK